MKLGKIIKKNLKLLLRSSVSSLVLILGPILVILLVGVSFSTNSFNLRMGIYSDKYSDLSIGLVDKLASEKYTMVKYDSEPLCVGGVIAGETHACIIFPPDMAVDGKRSNVIRFYVDQSKVNLVYLVMSTLTSSIGETSTKISQDLTQTILTSLQDNKKTVSESLPLVEQIIINQQGISEKSDSSKSSLQSLDLTVSQISDVETQSAKVQHELDNLLLESGELVSEGMELADKLDPWVQSNGTTYLNRLETSLDELNATLGSRHNITSKELVVLMENFKSSLDDILLKMDQAKNTNAEVISKLTTLNEQASAIKQDAEKLQDNLKSIVSNVDSIKIKDAGNIVSPIQTEINTVVKAQNNLGFLFPSLIVMLIMFIGVFMSSTIIVMEKNSRARFRVFSTPTKNWVFDLATYLTSMLLLISQVTLILIVSQLAFSVNFLTSVPTLILSLLAIISFFILLGMLIGYLFKTEEIALLAGVCAASVMLLTSGIIFPLESMPSYIAQLARFNPVVVSTELFKSSFLFGSGFDSISQQLNYLLVSLIVLITFIIIVRKSDFFKAILKKPAKKKIKSEWLVSQFEFGGRKAKTLAEFIVSIQNKNEEHFALLLKKNAYSDWLHLVYKNNILAEKVSGLRTKEEILKLLVEELKKIS